MLTYKIFVTNMEQYSFVGEELVDNWYEKQAELKAEGKIFTTKVEYHQYELTIEHQWAHDNEEYEDFVLYDMDGNEIDFDDDECDEDAPELHTFENVTSAMQHAIDTIADFEAQTDEFFYADGLKLELVDIDSGEVLVAYDKHVVHVVQPEPHLEFVGN